MRDKGRSERFDSRPLEGPRRKQKKRRQPQEARTGPWLTASGDLSPNSAQNYMGQQQE